MSHILSQLPGGVLAILTILLALIFLSAWKAPKWVRPIGSIALAFCAVHYLFSFMWGLSEIQKAGAISPTVMAGGLMTMNLLVMYSLLIYLVSHIISFIQKPNR